MLVSELGKRWALQKSVGGTFFRLCSSLVLLNGQKIFYSGHSHSTLSWEPLGAFAWSWEEESTFPQDWYTTSALSVEGEELGCWGSPSLLAFISQSRRNKMFQEQGGRNSPKILETSLPSKAGILGGRLTCNWPWASYLMFAYSIAVSSQPNLHSPHPL